MRRLVIAFIPLLCSSCALLGHGGNDRASAASDLVVSELRRAWSGYQELHGDSAIVIVRVVAPCKAECTQAVLLPVPRPVQRFVTDSLHARLATSDGRKCTVGTPTVRRVCTIPGEPSVLTMTVPPLVSDTAWLASDWNRNGKGSSTRTMYVWRRGKWIFPAPSRERVNGK